MNKGWVSEVFISRQGEGPFTGVKQVFVRLSGCSFGCAYCDTKHARGKARFADLGKRIKNPVSVQQVMNAVRRLGKVHSVSLTGGEPMEQPVFLTALLKALKKNGYLTYLETNAVHPRELSGIIGLVDFVSADIKLPSSGGTPDRWYEQAYFLKKAGKKAFAKIVLTKSTAGRDLEKALELAAKTDIGMTVCVQPDQALGLDGARRMFHGILKKTILKDLRITPQLHKITGQR